MSAQSRRMTAKDVDALPLGDLGHRIAYGDAPQQFGDLRLPPGPGPFPLVVILHGGCWYSPYAGLGNTAPLAEALTKAGAATWNVEYRQYDQPGGGWPGTLTDAAQGVDFARVLAGRYPLDTTRVVLAGHSAGGQLALWAASRQAGTGSHSLGVREPLGGGSTEAGGSAESGGSPLGVAGVVSIGGITDLVEFHARERSTCGNPAVESLLGGLPTDVPDRVQAASPIARLPLGVPSVHVAGSEDFIAPERVIDAYLAAARAHGDSASKVIVPAQGHFEAIAPATAAGKATIRAILDLVIPQRASPSR